MKNSIKEIKYKDTVWIDITNPDKEAMEFLREKYKFHPLDLEDVINPTQRSKIDRYDQYIFLILMFPIYNRTTKEIDASEVDFFLGKDFLVTIHSGELAPLVDLVQICQANEQAKENNFGDSPQMLLYNILKKLHLYVYPMLDHVSLDIVSIKKEIFAGHEKDMVKRIMEIRRNITDFRKIMDAHQATLERLMKKGIGALRVDDKYADYYDDLIDYTKEIWDQLGSFKESIEALQQTNESLISFRLNDVMKVLTIFSVTLLPASVVAGLFGVNARYLPFKDHPWGFYIIIAITLCASITTLIFIVRKRWNK